MSWISVSCPSLKPTGFYGFSSMSKNPYRMTWTFRVPKSHKVYINASPLSI